MRILIIDDELEVAKLLAEAVGRQGHTVQVAHTGKEALARIARERPDAVFLDLAMPDMSGIEVLRRLRRSEPTLPVVVITAHADDPVVQEARALGVEEIVEKPAALKLLDAAVERLDRRSKHS